MFTSNRYTIQFGALDEGPQCCLSVLRIGNVMCLCHLFSLMSHGEFKNRPSPMSLQFYPSCRLSPSSMLHVKFKKCSCRPNGFRDQGPSISSSIKKPFKCMLQAQTLMN